MYNCDCKNIHYINRPVGTCVNDLIEFGFPATEAGVHQLKLSFLSSELTIEKEFQPGEQLAFPTVGLNESHEWIGNIIGPDGESVKPVDINGKLIDCFSFTTTIKIEL